MTEKQRKTATLTIRITPEAKAMLERLADRDGRSIASYIERLIRWADSEADGVDDMLRQRLARAPAPKKGKA